MWFKHLLHRCTHCRLAADFLLHINAPQLPFRSFLIVFSARRLFVFQLSQVVHL